MRTPGESNGTQFLQMTLAVAGQEPSAAGKATVEGPAMIETASRGRLMPSKRRGDPDDIAGRERHRRPGSHRAKQTSPNQVECDAKLTQG